MSQLPDLTPDTFARRLRSLAPAIGGSRPVRSATASGGAGGEPLGPGIDLAVLDRLLDERALGRLHAHYAELRRWSPRLSLVGPGTTDDAVERHYGEALAALPLIPTRLLGPGLFSGVASPEAAASPEVPGTPGDETSGDETPGDETPGDEAPGDEAATGPGPAAVGTLVDVGSGAGFPGFVLAAVLPWLDAWLVEPRQRRWAFLLAAARRASLPCRCLDARVEDPLPTEFPAALDLVTVRALKLPPEALDALARRLSPGGRVLLWAGDSLPALPPGLRREAEVEVPGSERRRVVALAPA